MSEVRLVAQRPHIRKECNPHSVSFWKRSNHGLFGGLLTLSTTTAPAFMTHFML
jgi:hypothetical protein